MSGKKNKRKRRAERKEASGTKKQKKPQGDNSSNKMSSLIFQEVMKDFLDPSIEMDHDQDEAVSLAFFELANSPSVGFQVNNSQSIVLKQDTSACGKHTGGIVWETAYLLLQYLLSRNNPLGKTLEVGSGCGLVGQVLAAQKMADKVVMTEHADVIPNLTENVKNNQLVLKGGNPLSVCNLDWEKCEEESNNNQQLESHSFDTIVGTDVVFSPKLVEPLWRTLKHMSHSKTNIYLCLQERCAVSHKLLSEKASDYGFCIKDITGQLGSIPTCKWGQALECRLFHITHIANDANLTSLIPAEQPVMESSRLYHKKTWELTHKLHEEICQN